MKKNYDHSSKMKYMPIGQLIASMSLPAMFSMFVQALYNIVDSYFVASIDTTSDNMIRALGYAFPMQIIIMAVAFGIGVGTNVLIAKKLGEKNRLEASEIAKTGLIMAIFAGIIFFGLSFIIVKPFFRLMSNIDEVVVYGNQYLTIVMMFSLGMFVEIACNKILQGTGQMILPMIMQLVGAICNIILDPILIKGLWIFPEMGIKGAAVATVISQWLAMLVAIGFLVFKKFEINLSFKKFHLKLKQMVQIIVVGTPAMMTNAIASVTNFILHTILKIFDPNEVANAVLTTYIKFQSFVFMPIFGLNQGGMPILSYNYGANDKKRFYSAISIFVKTAITIMIIGMLIFLIFPSNLIKLFTPTDELLSMGTWALRIHSFGFIPASISIIFSMMFQSSGRGRFALLMSLLRQLLLLVPFIYILGVIGGTKLIWFGYPLAELIVLLSFIPILKTSLKKAFDERDLFYKNYPNPENV